MSIKYFHVILLASLVTFISCTKEDQSRSASDSDIEESSDGSRFSSDCGTLVNGSLKNPVKKSDGILITGSVASPYSIIMNLPQGRALLKFNGLTDVEYFRDDAAMSYLSKKITGNLYYYEALKDCTDYVSGGGEAFVGQIYNEQGENISEEMIKAGFAAIDSYDNCGTPELSACYQALQETAVQIGGSVSDFLWKPESDKDGKLAVLMNPYGAEIKVGGETLVDYGPGNGRGTTGRGKKSGCGYGANITITAKDSEGRILLFPGGAQSYTIKDGCQRTQFK